MPSVDARQTCDQKGRMIGPSLSPGFFVRLQCIPRIPVHKLCFFRPVHHKGTVPLLPCLPCWFDRQGMRHGMARKTIEFPWCPSFGHPCHPQNQFVPNARSRVRLLFKTRLRCWRRRASPKSCGASRVQDRAGVAPMSGSLTHTHTLTHSQRKRASWNQVRLSCL